jgi:hypothetical protein
MGWKNSKSADEPLEGATLKPVFSPYKFPEKLINGDIVITITGNSTNRFVFRVNSDEITWE